MIDNTNKLIIRNRFASLLNCYNPEIPDDEDYPEPEDNDEEDDNNDEDPCAGILGDGTFEDDF
jgi:hypothetical protein